MTRKNICQTRLLGGLLLGAAPLSVWAAAPTEGQIPHRAPAIEMMRRQPMKFEINAGQTDSRVKFIARGQGYGLFLTPTEAVISLAQGEPSSRGAARLKSRRDDAQTLASGPQTPAQQASARHEKAVQRRADAIAQQKERSKPQKLAVVRMKMRGANPQARVAGVGKLASTSNYLRGDAKNWRTGVAQFARVRMESVYPGIDMVYYGTGEKLEYDFVLAPHADPQRIRLAFDGAHDVRIDARGDLVLGVGGEKIVQHAPVVYQEKSGRRERVAGRYALRRDASGGAEVGFQLASYDRSKPLVIDPILSYLTYLGGSDEDNGQAVFNPAAFSFADSAGNVTVAGETASLNFPTTAGVFDRTPGNPQGFGSSDVFVTKLNASGGAIFSTYLGGDDDDRLNEAILWTDGSGNILLQGTTSSTNFPTTASAFQSTRGTDFFGDIFVAKLNANGTNLIYSTLLGGDSIEFGDAEIIGTSGEVLVSGTTASTDFPTTAGAFDRIFNGDPDGFGSRDAFVTRLNASGGAVYSTYLGGVGDDDSEVIAVVGDGVLLQIDTFSSDFPTTSGAFDSTYGGGRDIVLCKLNANGSGLVYSTYFGGSGDDSGSFYLINASTILGNGSTDSPNFSTTSGAFDTSFNGGTDAWVARFSSTNGAVGFSTLLGGSGDEGNSFDTPIIDGSGNILFISTTTSPNFPTTTGAFDRTLGGSSDVIITKLNAAGNSLIFSSYFGGNGTESVTNQLDGSNNIILMGTTNSSDLPVFNAVQSSYGGGTDIYVAKLNPTASSLVFSTYLGGNSVESSGPVFGSRFDSSGAILVTGTTNSANFPVSSDGFQRTFGGVGDAFLTKLSASGALQYSTYFGGNGNEQAFVQVLASDTLVLSGITTSNVGFPIKSAVQNTYGGGGSDCFVAKISTSGALVYSTYLGGSGEDSGFGLADNAGTVYIIGDTTSANLPTTTGAFQRNYGGSSDIFVAKISDGGGTTPDTTPPTIAVGTPANNAVVTSLPTISGTASDSIGVTRVDLYLQRKSDNKYWNGTTWTSATALATTLSGTGATRSWTRNYNLPSGANLQNGDYFIAARAFDAAGNGTSATRNFRVGSSDATPPSISIGTPANNAVVSSLPTISGVASDNIGITRVDLYLQRKSDNKYWNGTTWTGATALATTLSGIGTTRSWTRNFGLPSGANLQSGNYFIAARAFDAANNGTSATRVFSVNSGDATPPSIAIATPANNAIVKGLPAISGTAADNAGVTRVDLFLQRKSDNKFWNGSAWGAPATVLTTTLSGAAPRQWTRNFGLPSGANLQNGAYFIAARAYDAANNGTSATRIFTVDTILPSVSILSPAIGSTVNSFASASGQASDNTGIARVAFYLRRNADMKWWNGGAYVASPVELPTMLTAGNGFMTWSISSLLPKGANLTNGSYFISASSYDRAGNTRFVNGNITLNGAAAAATASPVALSSAVADADGTIQLSFTGALGARATDAKNYSVALNEQTLAVESATCINASTVELATAALSKGARVAVSYAIEDAQGRTLSGVATVVVK